MLIAVMFVLFLAVTAFGGIGAVVAIASDRPADRAFVRPMLFLAACGTAMVSLILWGTL